MLVKDIVAGKKYITRNGEEKTRWTTVGQLFIKDDGKMTVKFNEYINPMAFCNDKGEVWFNVFEKKEKDGAAPKEADPFPAAKPAKTVEMDDTITAISEGDEQWLKENAEPDVELPF